MILSMTRCMVSMKAWYSGESDKSVAVTVNRARANAISPRILAAPLAAVSAPKRSRRTVAASLSLPSSRQGRKAEWVG